MSVKQLTIAAIQSHGLLCEHILGICDACAERLGQLLEEYRQQMNEEDETDGLYFVEHKLGWGYARDIVRAVSEEEALHLAGAHPESDVTFMSVDGPSQVLWSESESPDTGDRD